MKATVEALCERQGWALSDDCRITVPLPSGRQQQVRYSCHERAGVGYVRLMSPLGEARNIDDRQARAALRLNWTVPYGAVALASIDEGNEKLIMCATAFHDPDHPEHLRLAIEHLAATADEYEKHVFGRDDY